MPRIGFDSSGTTPYVYIETQSGLGPTICSTAIGMDSTDTDKNTFKIATGPLPNITPETLTPNFSIDPTANGDVTLRANGLGDINLISPNITTTGGILKADITTGKLTISGAVATTYDADSGSATPSGNTITIAGGSGISTSAAGSTITIAATGGGAFTWSVQSGTSQAAAVNHGYFTNNAGVVTVTLPGTAAVGDTIRISGLGAGGWLMAQNAGQSVNMGSSSTTVGVGGSLASTAQYDSIELVCCVANNTFNVVSSMGNIIIV